MRETAAGLRLLTVTVALVIGMIAVVPARADTDRWPSYGFMFSVGGRFDNVRLCPATPPGSPAGFTMDISAIVDVPIDGQTTLRVNVPVLRPILFGAAFGMLQFEPFVALLFHEYIDDNGWDDYRRWQLVAGPVLGLSLHYGPDYASPFKKAERTSPFFAMGPLIGASFTFDRQVMDLWHGTGFGLMPYVTPLFGADVPDPHRGLAVGGRFELSFHSRWD